MMIMVRGGASAGSIINSAHLTENAKAHSLVCLSDHVSDSLILCFLALGMCVCVCVRVCVCGCGCGWVGGWVGVRVGGWVCTCVGEGQRGEQTGKDKNGSTNAAQTTSTNQRARVYTSLIR